MADTKTDPNLEDTKLEGGDNKNPAPEDDKKNTGNEDTENRIKEAVAAAVAEAKSNWDKEFQSKLDDAKKEGERLAKLSADERASEERKAEQEKFDAERAKFAKEKLAMYTSKELTAAGLPETLAAHISCDSEDSIKTAVDALKEAFETAVNEGVKAKLAGSSPNLGGDNHDPAGGSFMDIIAENQR